MDVESPKGDLPSRGGIHFRTADEHGARIGKQVARWREQRFFQRSCDDD